MMQPPLLPVDDEAMEALFHIPRRFAELPTGRLGKERCVPIGHKPPCVARPAPAC